MKASALLLACACAAIAGATDHVVGPAGSGAPFTSIQAAIDAAQPGDRVLVLPGTYNGAVVVTKAIELIGSGSSSTTSQSLATFPGVVPIPIGIGNLGVGQRIRVAGFRFTSVGAMSAPNPAAMVVHDCLGRVEISDVVLPGGGLAAYPVGAAAGILWIRDCSQVTASGVRAEGAPTTFGIPIPGDGSLRHGHAGVLVERSSVWMTDCVGTGNATRFVSSGYAGDGGAGLLSIDALVHVATSAFRGGQSGGQQNGVAGSGGAGIDARTTTLTVHGATGNLAAGAAAFEAVAGGVVGLGGPGAAIVADGGSALVYAADVVLAPGAGSFSYPPAPAISALAGAFVFAAPVKLPSVSLPAYAPQGGPLTVRIYGQPGIDHLRSVSLETAPAQVVSGLFGLLLFDLATVLTIHVETLDANGEGTIPLTVPVDPSIAGIAIVEQAAQIYPGVAIPVSPPAICTLGL